MQDGSCPKQASKTARASAAAASGQGRVSLCRARHERGGGEAGERGQQARGVQPRIHAAVSDELYLLRVAWCVLHALYRARAAYAAVTLLRSCMRRGMALGWTRSRGDL